MSRMISNCANKRNKLVEIEESQVAACLHQGQVLESLN